MTEMIDDARASTLAEEWARHRMWMADKRMANDYEAEWGGTVLGCPDPETGEDSADRSALLTWVRSADAEVRAGWQRTPVNDREAVAHAIGLRLGRTFAPGMPGWHARALGLLHDAIPPVNRPSKADYVERLTGRIMPDQRDSELAAAAREGAGLDGVYSGSSARIRRILELAYLRGVRRGAGLAWDASRPVEPGSEP